MTDNTRPDAGSTHIIRYALEMGLLWIDGDGRDKVREALDALDILEAQLSSSGFTAADMATASAQGFRDGVASVAASAGSEPVPFGHWFTDDPKAFATPGSGFLVGKEPPKNAINVIPLYTHPSPPEGMVGWWMPIETAPGDMGAYLFLSGGVTVDGFIDATGTYCVRQEARSGWRKMWRKPTHWMPLPPPPTTSAGSGKGE